MTVTIHMTQTDQYDSQRAFKSGPYNTASLLRQLWEAFKISGTLKNVGTFQIMTNPQSVSCSMGDFVVTNKDQHV